VGISGWRYAGWRGDFYPTGLAQRRELEYAASLLTSIEVNGSFYSLQRASSYAAWRDATPADFVFAVKGGRFITHMKKLVDVDGPLANFFASGVLALGDKLGPVLWQLPETLGFDRLRLADFFARLPRTTAEAAVLARRHDSRVKDPVLEAPVDRPIRHALEFRSSSFLVPETTELLARHDVACVLADTAGRWPKVDADTSDFRYVRLHGDRELYASGYGPEALDRWASACTSWAQTGEDVFVYFDNDAKGFAPHDARGLIDRLRERAGQRHPGR
jgi:uncharacterized protein YecE (DUF72 family)